MCKTFMLKGQVIKMMCRIYDEEITPEELVTRLMLHPKDIKKRMEELKKEEFKYGELRPHPHNYRHERSGDQHDR